ncbi:deaminase [Planctomonas sp. JC2975]|uniref:dihydrofolate reductase family protein n=1 Tax=Planctomonas sp. JC2975 TaxID=2729626 RepID=UPI001475F747|nr:dihydrofolate reductase family protein [Planctomonas sp. JC2975]NNC12796.1 deaminase [Planctomonas sp. JC2975]
MTDERGRITIDLFSTLDGVQQAPGGPDEDTSDGFRFGGWQAPVTDDVAGAEILKGMDGMDALLLGRRTYDIFAGYWPLNTGNPIGDLFDRIPKYVVSRGTPNLAWADSTHLGPDTLAEVDRLRDVHRNVHVIGSIDFARTLFDTQLFDQLTLWVYPVVLGRGKRLFDENTVPASLRLLAAPVTSGTGAVLLRYGPNGAPTVGTMEPE